MSRPTTEEKAALDARATELRPIIRRVNEELRGANKKIAARLNSLGVLNLRDKEWTDDQVGTFKLRYMKDATSDTIAPTSTPEAPKEEEAQQEPATSDAIVAATEDTPESKVDKHQDASATGDAITGGSEQECATGDNIIDTSLLEAVKEREATLLSCEEFPEAKGCTDETTFSTIPPTTIPGAERPTLPDDVIDMLVDFHAAGELECLIDWWRTGRKEERVIPMKRPILKGPQGRVNTGLLIDKALKDRALAAAKKDQAGTGGSLSLLIELLLWRFLGEPKEFIVETDEEPA